MAWDDYCSICGCTGRVNRDVSDEIDEFLSVYNEKNHSQRTISPNVRTKLLHDIDRAFTEQIVVIGPFDEALNPIIDSTFGPVETPPTSSTEYVVEAGDALLQYSAEEVRIVDGLVIGGTQLGDLIRVSDRKGYTCSGNVYPFMHARCLQLLCDCTLLKTPQKYWEVVRTCNGVSWQAQGLRGIDYGEITETHDQYVWCFALVPGDYEEWLESFIFKVDLDEADLEKFRRDLTWIWTAPDRFPIGAAAAQKDSWTKSFGSAMQTPTAVLDTSIVNRFIKLPVEIISMIAANLGLLSFLQLIFTSRIVLQTMSTHVNTTVRGILQRTQRWWLPHGEMEQKYWDTIVMESGVKENFPWLSYAKECVTNSPSMRNRRRIWRIMEQIEAVALDKGLI